MTIKQHAIQIIEELPDDATCDDVQERIDFVAAVRHALLVADKGEGIPHERILEEYAAWLTD